jgi:hypothetical protein
MITRTLSLLALTAFVSAAAATQASAGACCGCAYTCAPPAQVQIWGLSPSYVVNQGPVYTGPGYYTAPTYEGEASTVDYPYVGYGYPRYQRSRHEADVGYRPGFGRRAITMSVDGRLVSGGHREFREPRVR